MDELYESSVHHLVVEGHKTNQGDLVGVEFLHVFGGQLSADGFVEGVSYSLDEGISAFLGCLAQSIIRYRCFDHNFCYCVVLYPNTVFYRAKLRNIFCNAKNKMLNTLCIKHILALAGIIGPCCPSFFALAPRSP